MKAAVKDLTAKGVQAYGAGVDVADKAALQKFIADSAQALGGIDILVANVSALAAQDVEESWSQSFDVDMMHTVNAVTAALPYLEKSKHPSIVIVSSVSGREVDFTGPGLWRHEGGAYSLRAKTCVSARVQDDPGEFGLAGQHLFRRRHLAEYRNEPA